MKYKSKVVILLVLAMALGYWALSFSPPVEPAGMPVIEPFFMWIKHFQMALDDAGYDPGPIDCVYGPQTRAAWDRYEADYMAQEVK